MDLSHMRVNFVAGFIGTVSLILISIYFFTRSSLPSPLTYSKTPPISGVSPVVFSHSVPPTLQPPPKAINTIVANEQHGDGTALNFTSVNIEVPGFLIIRNYVNDTPGVIVGTSDLLFPGELEHFSIPINRPYTEGDWFAAELHEDDGDGVFTTSDRDTILSKIDGSQSRITFSIESHDDE